MSNALITDVVRTSAGLRAALFDELDRLRKGESDAKASNALVRISDGIIRVVKMDLEVQRHLQGMPGGQRKEGAPIELPGTINLGKPGV